MKKLKTLIPIILSLIIWLSLCNNNNIWYDEYYTIGMLDHNIMDIIKITSFDVHPPLYYILLKLYTFIFSNSLLSLKIFSMLPLIGIIILNEIEIKKIFDERISNIFNVLFITSSIVMQYALEVRMYSLSMFLLFGMVVYAIKYLKNNNSKDLVFMTIFSILGIYSHYYVLLSAIIIYLILLIVNIKNKKFLLNIFISGVFNVILYIPWLYTLINQLLKVKKHFWISKLTISGLLKYPKELFLYGKYTNIFLIFILIIMLIAFIIFVKKKLQYKREIIFCILVFMLTFIVGIVVSFLYKPVLISRYLTIQIVSCLILCFALLIGNINNRILNYFIIIIFICFGIVSYTNRYNLEIDNSNKYTKTIKNYIKDNDSVIFISNADHAVVINYYFDNYQYYAFNIYNYSPFYNIKKYNEDKLKESNNVWFIERTDTEYKFKNCSLEKVDTLYLDEWLSFDLYKVIYN